MIKQSNLASWAGVLEPKQGLLFDPPPTGNKFAKNYAVLNSGDKPIKIIVVMLVDEP